MKNRVLIFTSVGCLIAGSLFAGDLTLQLVGSTPIAGGGVQIVGSYAYAVDAEGLKVLDVSTPSNPSQIGSLATSYAPAAVFVLGNYAYVADSYGLEIIDVSTPSLPVKVGQYYTSGYGNDVHVVGQKAYVTDGASLTILNIADPITRPAPM